MGELLSTDNVNTFRLEKVKTVDLLGDFNTLLVTCNDFSLYRYSTSDSSVHTLLFSPQPLQRRTTAFTVSVGDLQLPTPSSVAMNMMHIAS